MDRTDRRGLVTLSRGRDMRRLLAISVLGATMLVAMVATAITLPSVPDGEIDLGFFVFLFTGLGLYWGLGALIVMRANGHVIGWLFALAAAMMVSVFACYGLGFVLTSSQPPDPLGGWLSLVGSLLFPPAVILILPAVALTFPTGSLPGPRWRWPVRLVAVMVAIRLVVIVVRPGPMGDGAPDSPLTPWLPAVSPSVLEILGALDAIGSLSLPLGAGLPSRAAPHYRTGTGEGSSQGARLRREPQPSRRRTRPRLNGAATVSARPPVTASRERGR